MLPSSSVHHLSAELSRTLVSIARVEEFVNFSSTAVAVFDRDMRYVSASKRWIKDYSLRARSFIGVSHYELFPEIQEGWRNVLKRGLAGETIVDNEGNFVRQDGTIQWLRWEVVPWYVDGSIGGIVIFSEEISERINARERINIAKKLFDESKSKEVKRADELALANLELAYQSGEKAKRADELALANVELAYQSGEKAKRANELAVANIELAYQSGEKAKRADEFQSLENLHKELEALAKKVSELAFHDALTELPNRRLLIDRLSQAMTASKRSRVYGALMFLDLDNFKSINDTHGHTVGDLLLIEAAQRLTNCIRDMDTVARFGGDEFVVMLAELDKDKTAALAQAAIVAEKIRVFLSEPYVFTITHNKQADTLVKHSCTASVGVTMFIGHESSKADIMKRADTAMYQAKESGRNQIRFYVGED